MTNVMVLIEPDNWDPSLPILEEPLRVIASGTAIAMAIRQAVQDGCQIINMSLRVSYPIVPAVYSAVKFASSKGVVMVCAAGNSGDGDPTTNEMHAYVYILYILQFRLMHPF